MDMREWALSVGEAAGRALQGSGTDIDQLNEELEELFLLTFLVATLVSICIPLCCAYCYLRIVKEEEKDLPMDRKAVTPSNEMIVYFSACCFSFVGLCGAYLYISSQREQLKRFQASTGAQRYPTPVAYPVAAKAEV
mmetsp:Transcript_5227/g.9838  ORF Transcript_5227/g.9838 Transcript_5227/m.9838 type:complete len:137 (+) Transcript_5227:138-548(+)